MKIETDNQKTAKDTAKQKKGLFLRISSENFPKIDAIKNLLSIFEGKTPVYLFFTDTKKYEFLGMEYLTDVNIPLINELKYKLGEENVVLRQ